jgi:hypothetical protein|tara:strand:+ start:558 stop:1073 length:516 start_codon:yes stop_codon:yes gene_type:complete
MQTNLWFSQSGETYQGMPCDDIYGGCPQDNQGNFIVDRGVIPIGNIIPQVSQGLPSPNATATEIANDVGYIDPKNTSFCQGQAATMRFASEEAKQDWMDKCMQNNISQMIENQPIENLPINPLPAPTMPTQNGCGSEEFTIPFKIQGEEKCIDKTIALVIGAIAIYYIVKK